jgi:hypothetical protein
MLVLSGLCRMRGLEAGPRAIRYQRSAFSFDAAAPKGWSLMRRDCGRCLGITFKTSLKVQVLRMLMPSNGGTLTVPIGRGEPFCPARVDR